MKIDSTLSYIRFAALLALVAQPLFAADPFADIVRKTDPLSPEQERQGFHLPPGFDVQLFAAEPDIGKPMNMAFDEKGRLWITQSREYPFPAPKDRKGRDVIKVLEDTDGDGRADRIKTFADGLSIPIGLYPYRDGVIAFSIPNISYFQDTDGDGTADKTNFLYGPIGHDKDTHGLTSAFRRGFDGWVYACHGFNNTTTLTGRDGSSITMQSGNTYRMRPDGSRVEQFTHGQVNPFGLMFDPLGNLYSADCHSSPIYQLLRDGYYPSFGKPDDGLGFAPSMMHHTHGSTAIGGIVFYAAKEFPPAFQSNVFVGNVMTCRINRDRLEDHGSTRLAREQPDFLSSDDPWFRPVDLQLGPDGAIYVADFYNRIIGHYEVPLDHPGRDRERGRIWRITYRGENAARRERFDLSRAGAEKLIAALADDNITVRMLAMNQLVDRVGAAAVAPLKQALRDSSNPYQKAHALWALQRLDGADADALAAAASDASPIVRVHAMRVISERPAADAETSLARAALKDSDAFVQRAATDALGRHPEFANVRPLLDLLKGVPDDDTHLRYTARMALRDQLRVPENMARLPLPQWTADDARAVADVALAVPTSEAAAFLLQQVRSGSESQETVGRYLRHAARYLPEDKVDVLADVARRQFKDDLDLQVTLFKSVQEGTAQRGAKLGPELSAWGVELATRLLQPPADAAAAWYNTPVAGLPDSPNPWVIQKRDSADGNKGSTFFCSFPNGEKLTGILRSQPFTIPDQLKFFVAGHDGFPDKPINRKNFVRLRSAAGDRVLKELSPPRNDLAQPITWDLKTVAGQRGYLEIVDADTAGAYAWLAFGRLEPEVVPFPKASPADVAKRQQSGAEIARLCQAGQLAPQLARIVRERSTDLTTRVAATEALTAVAKPAAVIPLGEVLQDPSEPARLREAAAQGLGDVNSAEARQIVLEALRTAPQRLEGKLAQALADSPAGAGELLDTVAAGKASPRLLQDTGVRERLAASKVPQWQQRVETLTANLEPADEQRQKLIDDRRQGFAAASPAAADGQAIFTVNCAVCHQIDGNGGLVGPQLDGVGNRGAERLIEDILDPSRNVDAAFRYSNLTLADDQYITGLQRREEGEILVFADATGKEIKVPKDQIKERIESKLSLMPDNFGELIAPKDFNNLIAYLLTKSATASASAK